MCVSQADGEWMLEVMAIVVKTTTKAPVMQAQRLVNDSLLATGSKSQKGKTQTSKGDTLPVK